MSTVEYYRRAPIHRKPRPMLRLLTDIQLTLAGPIVIAAGAFLVGGPLGSLWIIIALAMMMRNVRRSQAMIVVNYVEQAVRLNLPIPAMLTAAADAEGKKLRKRLARVRDSLEAGSPVAAAMQSWVPGLPSRVLGLLRAGEQVGRLPHALRRVVEQEQMFIDRRPVQSIFLRWYPILILVCILPVFWMVFIFVLPKYHQILRDFHLPLPAATKWLIDFWDAMQIPLAMLAVGTLAVISGRMLAEILPQRGTSFSPFRAIGDRLAWYIPPWRGVTRSRALADVCYTLADAIEAGVPMDRALDEAAEACPNRLLGLRLRNWSRLVSLGTPTAQAARQSLMPEVMVGMLQTAQGPRGMHEVLTFLWRYYDSRFSTAMALLQGAAIPLMVAIAAIAVLIAALGLFMPLVELMTHLGGVKGVM